ncbi:MAG TPA: ADP-ribosylglycohydrolase family protein [Oscillatoriales cyanobacterium M59_W2019_021]|nr:MAG: ADP-ribosylglycohydrolase family protein [Cyanobacteria bacterium J055]HIK30553.1 ADP-ribosylglycohydrolase family protein [Oscillatoriales cyanobacterium M4454_W2019_049]HIK50498.1 ADP-ribosylglycohydrolase family protein [Oscillatoriales cyanobacterium M59_W2019_021]
MLLELAIGDAYGAGFEFADEMLSANDLSGYVQHPRSFFQAERYTDDTQMSLAIAETIVNRQPWTERVLAENFLKVFKRDPRKGYAKRMYQYLQETEDAESFIKNVTWSSDASGAAMRSAPIGVFSTIDRVMAASQLQAAITHKSKDGINASVAAALMAHYFIYNLGNKQQLGEFLDTYVCGYHWMRPQTERVSMQGICCVRAAVTAIIKGDSLSQILRDCVAFGGDVDTVAAIALAAASCSSEIESDLPEVLISGLENEAYGRDYLVQLDRQLMGLVRG